MNGVALFAISYDSVEILRDFAATHGIMYPLLSDEGSHAMRGLGLINDRIQEDHAVYGIKPNARHVNLPYPGVYVLDRAGVVTQKRFYESYRERDTGTGLIAQALGIVTESSAPIVATNGPVVTARAWLDSPTYVFFQRVVLTVEVSIAPGFHVYGQPAADGLTPLSIEIDAIDGLEVGPARWPSPRRFTRPGVNDELWVHEGIVRRHRAADIRRGAWRRRPHGQRHRALPGVRRRLVPRPVVVAASGAGARGRAGRPRPADPHVEDLIQGKCFRSGFLRANRDAIFGTALSDTALSDT